MAQIGIFRTSDATKAFNDALQANISKGLLDPKNMEQMTAATNAGAKAFEDLSDAAKVAGSALPQFQSALNDASSARKQLDGFAVEAMSVNRGFFTTFGQQLRSGASAWGAFKTAGLDALGKLSDKLMSMAADSLFAAAFGGKGGAGGLLGGLGSLFGLGGSGAQAASAATLAGNTGGAFFGPGFASGTSSAPGGMALVGEKGPELVRLPRGAQVYNNGQTRGMMGGSSVNMGDTVVNLYGNTDEYGLSQVRQELASHRKALAGIVKQNASSQRYAATGVS